MSSKGTIFLTSLNEHVYDETNDWSIVFEIDAESIERITYRWFNKEDNKCYFDEIKLNEIEYIVIQTRSNYDFIDSFKKYIFNKKDFYLNNEENEGNYLIFYLRDLEYIVTDKKDYFDNEKKICKLWDIEVKLKENSEWLREYKKYLLKYIDSKIKRLEEIENIFNRKTINKNIQIKAMIKEK